MKAEVVPDFLISALDARIHWEMSKQFSAEKGMTQEFYSQHFVSEDLRKRLLDMQSVRKYSTYASFLKRLLKCDPAYEKQSKVKSSKMQIL